MLKAWVVGVVVLMAAGPAVAQVPADVADTRARQRISRMEAVLERAVLNGAESMVRQMRQVMGEPPMLSGPAQARGHRLEGFGVFFDVGVPLLRMPLLWTVRQMTAEPMGHAALADLRDLAPRLAPADRVLLEDSIRRLEAQLERAPRAARATRPTTLAAASATSRATPEAVRPPVAPVEPIDDPNEAYTREVKAALIEAMLENSVMIDLAEDEWLAVAARDNMPRDPLMPGDLADFTTIQFRILGRDLAAFRERRISFEEAQQRVIVHEY